MKKIRLNLKKGIFVIIFLLFLACLFLHNDGMSQSGIANIHYKVYKKNSWSINSKNGMTSGNKKDAIKKIKIKMKDDLPIIEYYNNNKWSKKNDENQKVYAFRIINSSEFLMKYDLCYRSYNKKNKWLNWACNSEPSGNLKEPILAVEIKAIPKNVVKSDYLRAYIENDNPINIGF